MIAPADRRWWWLVAAAAVCTILYLAGSLGAAEIALVGHNVRAAHAGRHAGVAGATAAVVVLTVLAFCTIALSARHAVRAGGGVERLVGIGRSHRVKVAVAGHLVVLFVGVPLLAGLGRLLGASGTTTPGLHHRSAGYVFLISWLAILIAPWLEETSMRGFLLEGLWRRFGFWPAAVASALVWSALHGVSGVLLPFVALGMSFCWVRRTTGNTRTGIALHGAQNTFASLLAGAGAWGIPPAILLFGSLWVTRSGGSDRVTDAAHQAVGHARRVARWVVERCGTLPTLPVLAWSAAGLAVAVGIGLEAPAVLSDDSGSQWLTAGRVVIAVLAAPLLGWLLVTSPREWGASVGTAAAGLVGAILIIVGRLGDQAAIVPLGYVLVSYGLFGVALALDGRRARFAAGTAGFCLALSLAPVPYLITGHLGFVRQELIVLVATALGLMVLGWSLRRVRPGA